MKKPAVWRGREKLPAVERHTVTRRPPIVYRRVCQTTH